jgi:hypothetical protein
MRSSILCRERLDRIQRILERNAGALTVREFARTFSVWEWKIEQAAALGWLKIATRKPRTGRPSRIATIVSEPKAAKLPPYRWQIEKPISIRHWNFAFHSAYSAAAFHRCLFAGVSSRQEAPRRRRQHEPPATPSPSQSRPRMVLLQNQPRDFPR